jgi:PAS domain S-box-containing protein
MEIEAIYQTAPIGLAVLDTDLRYQRLNQRLAEINGISIEDHIGRTVREIVPALADANEPLLR